MKKIIVLCCLFILFCFLSSSLFSPSMAQINALTKSLKNNRISQNNNSTSNETEINKSSLNSILKSSNNDYQKQIDNNSFEEIRQFDSPIYYTSVKKKCKNGFKELMVLSIDQKYIKTPQNTLKTNVIIAPLRISEKGTPDILPLPMPIDIFGLPQETKEDIYCYKKLERMQNLIEKLTIENSSQNGSEIASINTEISINYAHRSDVYALMLLYYKDFLMKRAKITDTFKSLYSSSFECEYYNQLCNEFKDKSIGSKPLSILLNVAGNRSTEFFMNNQALKDRFTAINVEISQLEGKIKKRTTEIEKIFEELKNNLINKKTTKTDLAKTWISVNETMLLDSFNGTKKMEKYKSAEGCVVISNKLYLDGTMQYDQVTQKFNFVPLIKVFKN